MATIACPCCGRGSLTRHCPPEKPACSWSVCTVCRTTIDRVRTTERGPHHGHPSEKAAAACRLCASVPEEESRG